MERKYPSYIKEWRKHRGLTQERVLGRLAELAGEPQPNDIALAIPLTGASLSRIENGKQNFSMATLHALAKALDVEEPGWLLTRNPLKAGEVVSLFDHLDEEQTRQAAAVIRAMFATAI
jgi:transcriptional regulator with XRE-family HTH domain